MSGRADLTIDELRGVPPFFWMSAGEQRRVRSRLDIARVTAGHVVYRKGSTPAEVSFVLSGRLATSPPDMVFSAGSALGVDAAFTGHVFDHDVVALTDTTLAVMDRRRFLASLEDCPSFAANVLRLVVG